jgi:TRAP-type C4-dicarboxylate transport system permease large subunit
MNKTFPLIIAFFALATPALNICSDTTNATPTQAQDLLLKELEVLHHPIVIGAIITAAMVGPVKAMAAGALYAAIINREQIEAAMTKENLSRLTPTTIKDVAQQTIETTHHFYTKTQEQAKEMSQAWEKYKQSTYK